MINSARDEVSVQPLQSWYKISHFQNFKSDLNGPKSNVIQTKSFTLIYIYVHMLLDAKILKMDAQIFIFSLKVSKNILILMMAEMS